MTRKEMVNKTLIIGIDEDGELKIRGLYGAESTVGLTKSQRIELNLTPKQAELLGEINPQTDFASLEREFIKELVFGGYSFCMRMVKEQIDDIPAESCLSKKFRQKHGQ